LREDGTWRREEDVDCLAETRKVVLGLLVWIVVGIGSTGVVKKCIVSMLIMATETRYGNLIE
jgi:hypothetical protein